MNMHFYKIIMVLSIFCQVQFAMDNNAVVNDSEYYLQDNGTIIEFEEKLSNENFAYQTKRENCEIEYVHHAVPLLMERLDEQVISNLYTTESFESFTCDNKEINYKNLCKLRDDDFFEKYIAITNENNENLQCVYALKEIVFEDINLENTPIFLHEDKNNRNANSSLNSKQKEDNLAISNIHGIALNQAFFRYSDVYKIYTLCHELQHIKHNDIRHQMELEINGKSLILALVASDSYLYGLLKDSSIAKIEIDKYQENRCDTLAAETLCDNCLQEVIDEESHGNDGNNALNDESGYLTVHGLRKILKDRCCTHICQHHQRNLYYDQSLNRNTSMVSNGSTLLDRVRF